MAKKFYFVVGSGNPIKIQAVEQAVKQFWPEAKVFGVKIHSEVGNQPKTNQKTKKGAIARALKAIKSSKRADFGVGLESGIEFRKDGLWTFGWVTVVDRKGEMGLAKTIEFRLPPGLSDLINGGMEQSEADARFFKRSDRGEKEGTVGLLTKGKIKRTEAFSQAVIFALVPFLNPQYYK